MFVIRIIRLKAIEALEASGPVLAFLMVFGLSPIVLGCLFPKNFAVVLFLLSVALLHVTSRR